MKKYGVYLNDIKWTKIDNLNIKDDKGWIRSNIVFTKPIPYKELSNVRNEITWYLVSNNYIDKMKRLQSSIKEVREEIRMLESNCDIADYQAQKLFQILDKGGE